MGSSTLLCLTVLLYNVTGGNSIVGGKEAHKGAWPWMVYLETHTDWGLRISGGSLISNHWVMTGGSCFREIHNLERSFAWVGELSLKEPSGRRVKLKKVVTHPEFNTNNEKQMFFNDIALVQLQEGVSFSDTVKPVTLPSPRDLFSTDSECWVTGWGNVRDGRPLGGKQTLQEVQLSLVDDVMCLKLYPYKSDIHLCAGHLEGGKDSCQGDSGGPLVCVPAGELKRRFVQVGIVSFGRGCGQKGTARVYTHVSIYIKFILDSVSHTECNDPTEFDACFL